MDPVTLAILLFIAVAGLLLLGKLLGHLIGALAIVAAIVNDLADIGIFTVAPNLGWVGDIIVFILILLAYRNAGALISLLEIVPVLGILPLHTIALLISWKLKQKREETHVVRK